MRVKSHNDTGQVVSYSRSMKKIIIHGPGDYSKLKLEHTADLVSKETDEVIVDVKATGVNYADIIIRWGLYKSAKEFVGWPITPGFEFSGTIKGTQEKVMGVTLFNGYASQVKVHKSQLYPMPQQMSFEEAAAFPCVFMTAYHALLQNVVIREGMVALIHSAAGGVGSSLVQLCRLKGIKTIGVVGSTHKVEGLKSLGCDVVIDKSTQDLWREVKQHAPQGVDLAFDANGVETLKASYEHLAPCGKLIAYGAHSMFPKRGGRVNWPKLALDYLRTPRFSPLDMTSDNKSVVGFNLSFLFNCKDLLQEAFSDLLKWYEEGLIRLPKVSTYQLEDVASAHRDLESGKTEGKLVLTIV
jgi:synaptic vesicle membrane protein VAT-1